MFLEGKLTRLKPADIAIFYTDDNVVQFVRRGINLRNIHRDDKTVFSSTIILTEDLCTNIIASIAITHDLGFQNVTGIYKAKDKFFFKFLKLKR